MDSSNCLYFYLKTWVGNYFSSLEISCQSFGPTYFKDFFLVPFFFLFTTEYAYVPRSVFRKF